MNFSKREQSLVAVTLSLAVLSAGYIFVLEPIMKSWLGNTGAVSTRRTLLIKNLKLLTKQSALEEDYKKYSAHKISGADMEKARNLTLGKIEKISQKTKCLISSIKPLAIKREKNLSEISFEVTVKSGISEITEFLYSAETGEYFMRVKRLTITPIHGAQTSGKLKANFIISRVIISS